MHEHRREGTDDLGGDKRRNMGRTDARKRVAEHPTEEGGGIYQIGQVIAKKTGVERADAVFDLVNHHQHLYKAGRHVQCLFPHFFFGCVLAGCFFGFRPLGGHFI